MSSVPQLDQTEQKEKAILVGLQGHRAEWIKWRVDLEEKMENILGWGKHTFIPSPAQGSLFSPAVAQRFLEVPTPQTAPISESLPNTTGRIM